MDKLIKIAECDWQITIEDGDPAPNIHLGRAKGQNFHVTMINDSIVKPDGTIAHFRQPLLIEHEQDHDKVGDVVIQIRRNPATKRYMIQVEQENVFETETIVKKIWRATRSSVDNVAQAIKKTVAHSGWIYSNPRRIGGKPIKTHYVIAGWSPQLANQMMDVYDYVQAFDAQGLATFLKALQIMPAAPASAIFKQIRTPAE